MSIVGAYMTKILDPLICGRSAGSEDMFSTFIVLSLRSALCRCCPAEIFRCRTCMKAKETMLGEYIHQRDFKVAIIVAAMLIRNLNKR
ncbi:hypothetical protein KCP74_13200 [Salmonella enterica subsp. enterica]|nr:hypothetical protein KCP74_13200 [Salmonella enterica subsp. enterica]